MTTINDPLVGTTYDGRYRIARRIGAGGMANVYLAEDETLGRRVAIKVLHQRYAEDAQFVERFLREASAAARLNHPNIVQVYDRGESAGTYYIAMEYVDGMTLKELVQRRNGLTEQEVLAYGRQALHALRFAHRNGIVHRDVKPHNMMVDTDGRLKIADFGIARAGADSGLTEAGSIVGTAQYLSPEQAQGHDVAATSDLYSLGVVMFEMATGRVPFDGESPVNVALKHVKDPVPRPSSLKREITPPIESIILKAMEKDPSLRYASADEMLADLDRAREGSATQAMTQVLGAAAATSVLPGAGATQVTPLTPAVMPASSRRYEEPVAPEAAWPETWEDEREDRSSPMRWIIPLLIVLLLAGAAAYFLLADQGDPIPDVSGMTAAQARTELAEAGFDPGEARAEFSDDVPRNRVIGTDPEAGEEVEPDTVVDLIVSKGPQPVEIPSVANLSVAQARNKLSDAGFKPVDGEPEAHPKIAKGKVIRTSPAAGTEAVPGSNVTIIVSTGPEPVGVPNVVGRTEEDARSILEREGFTVRSEPVESSELAGTVVAQDPEPGEEVDAEKTTVTLQVANGNNDVPDVEGMTRQEAEDRLEAEGFVPNVTLEPTDDPAAVDRVLRQEQTGSRQVGSEVGIVVGVAGDQPTGEVPTEEQPGKGNGNANGRR